MLNYFESDYQICSLLHIYLKDIQIFCRYFTTNVFEIPWRKINFEDWIEEDVCIDSFMLQTESWFSLTLEYAHFDSGLCLETNKFDVCLNKRRVTREIMISRKWISKLLNFLDSHVLHRHQIYPKKILRI